MSKASTTKKTNDLVPIAIIANGRLNYAKHVFETTKDTVKLTK